MKRIFIFIYFTLAYFQNFASGNSDSTKTDLKINLGLTGGVTQHNLLNANAYLGLILKTKIGEFIEANSGFNFNSNKANYNGVKNIQYNCYGIFFDVNYGFKSGIFTGLRLQKDLSFVENSSLNAYKTEKGKEINDWFIGTTALFQVGFKRNVSKQLGMCLLAQAGIHNYIIEVPKNSRLEIYNTDFLGAFSFGLYYTIWKN